MEKTISAVLLCVCLTSWGQPYEKTVNSYVTMTNLVQENPNVVNSTAVVQGLTNLLDKLGGIFTYIPTSTNTVDGVDIFKPTHFDGRWIRNFPAAVGGGVAENLWATNSFFSTTNLSVNVADGHPIVSIDTSIIHTTGNLFEVKNKTTNIFSVGATNSVTVFSEGDGSVARLSAFSNIATLAGNLGAELQDGLSGNELRFFQNRLWSLSANSIFGGDISSGPDYPVGIINVHTNYFWGYEGAASTNYSRGAIYDTGTNGLWMFDSQASGIAGAPRVMAITNADLALTHTHTPGSSSETNVTGAITWDSTNLYIWISPSVNMRVPLTSW